MVTSRIKLLFQTQGADQAQAKVGKIGKSFNNMFNNIGSFVTAGALGYIIKDTIELASKAEGIERAFKRLDNPQLLANLRKATHETVSDLDLMRNAVSAENLGVPVEQLGTLFEFASRRARDTGESVEYLTESIVMGIGRQSVMILDNLGISAKDVRDRFKETGDFGKAVGDIVNVELKEMGEYIETAADRMDKLNTNIKNQQVELGQKLLPIWSEVLDTALAFTRIDFDKLWAGLTDPKARKSFWEELFGQEKKKEIVQANEEIGKAIKSAAEIAEEAYQKWAFEQDQRLDKQQLEIEYMQRYKEETTGWDLATQMAYSNVNSMIINYGQNLDEIAKKQDVVYDFDPALQYADKLQGAANKMSDMWSQALLNQWNEGQSFYQNMIRGFEQMLAAMAAQMAAKSAVFGIASIFGGGGLVTGGLGALDWIFGGLFEHGGKFQVPGSGTKEQPVLVGARPGETVTVSTPEQTPSGETINIIFEGNVLTDSFIEDIAIPKIARATRMGRA